MASNARQIRLRGAIKTDEVTNDHDQATRPRHTPQCRHRLHKGIRILCVGPGKPFLPELVGQSRCSASWWTKRNAARRPRRGLSSRWEVSPKINPPRRSPRWCAAHARSAAARLALTDLKQPRVAKCMFERKSTQTRTGLSRSSRNSFV